MYDTWRTNSLAFFENAASCDSLCSSQATSAITRLPDLVLFREVEEDVRLIEQRRPDLDVLRRVVGRLAIEAANRPSQRAYHVRNRAKGSDNMHN